MMIKLITSTLTLNLFFLKHVFAAIEVTDPWSFLVMPDQHVFTPFSFGGLDVPDSQEVWNESKMVLQHIRSNFGGDLVMMSGDSAGYGSVNNDEFAVKLGYPIEQVDEAIYEGGKNCYRAIRNLFNISGYDTILSCVGDHEIGGNKGFKVGGKNSKLLTVPSYRRAFGDGFNKDEDGSFLFDDPIGDVPSRPMGSIYEDTSFAYIHKNALFVTVDVFKNVGEFNFIDRENGLGGEGAITCDVSDDHLEWFESILMQGQLDQSIKHIFVQGHVPIVQPVRKVRCSGQFLDRGEDNEFWELMSKYGVDIYFAGEVHSNTASRSSNVVQIVTRGRTFSDFLKVEVADDIIDITLVNEIGDKPQWNGKYEEYGRLTIDKSDKDENKVSSSGELEIIGRDAALILFDFEEKFPLGHRQVLGLMGPDKLIATDVEIRSVNCTESILNNGSFGAQYDGQVGNVDIVPGRETGNSAGLFHPNSRFAIYGVGPFSGGEVMSFSLWIKTDVQSDMVLVHYGNSYGRQVNSVKRGKDHMTLVLSGGVPEVYIKHNRKLKADIGSIADGNWHQVAVSMPYKSCKLSEIEIFVDKEAVNTVRKGKETNIFENTHGRMAIGGFGSTAEVYETIFPECGPYEGLIDDFSLLAKPIQKTNGFKINRNYGCIKVEGDEPNFKIMPKFTSRKKCKNKCKKYKVCFGFEFSAGTCMHFSSEPIVGEPTMSTECSIKYSKMK